MILKRNPLTELAPVVPKCPRCFGHCKSADPNPITCTLCIGTGHAQPPVCETCGGKGQMEDYSGTGVTPAWDCPACSGTGRAKWDVLLTVDVFGECSTGTYLEYEGEQLPLTAQASDVQLAALFAVIAAHPDKHFYLPIETVASAERARKWMEQPFAYYCANLTLLAVAHDQPSLDALLPAVLAIPAAAHGVYLKGLDGAVYLHAGLMSNYLEQAHEEFAHIPMSNMPKHLQPQSPPLSILLLDEVARPSEESGDMAYAKWKRNAMHCDAAAAQARAAGVRVVAI